MMPDDVDGAFLVDGTWKRNAIATVINANRMLTVSEFLIGLYASVYLTDNWNEC